MEAFNIINDPWIPVIMENGERKLYSVRDTLKNAKNIKRISSPGSLPSEEYAIYRFLFALLTDAFQLQSDLDIEEIYQNGIFDLETFDQYITACGNVFNVFDEERPFMQCGVKQAREYGAKPENVAVLNWASLSGNTETFFGLRLFPTRKTYEESQYVSIPEYISLIINIAFMQSAITSGFPTAVCDNQPPLWFMFDGENLFDTLCLNMYPTDEEDDQEPEDDHNKPMWRRKNYLWYPKEEPDGWLALAFLPSRVVAPSVDGVQDGKVYKLLYNGLFYRGSSNPIVQSYPEPKSFYQYWMEKEPYIILRQNDPAKIKKGQRTVEAWRGPSGMAWMQMAEFYGVKLDSTTTIRPKAMQIFDQHSDREKGIIKRLPYKPKQSFYYFRLPTQSSGKGDMPARDQKVFRDFTVTDDWMFDDDKLNLINQYTTFSRFAMITLGESLAELYYGDKTKKESSAVKEIVNGWADQCAQYLYNSIIPDMRTIEKASLNLYFEQAGEKVIDITQQTLRNLISRDMFYKIEISTKLIGKLKQELKRRIENEGR